MKDESISSEILKHFRKRDFGSVVEAYRNNTDFDYSPQALVSIGRSLFQVGDDPAAAEAFWHDLIGHEKIDQYLVFVMLVRIALGRGEAEAAAAWVRRAEAADSGRQDARVHLVSHYLENGRDAEARRWLEETPPEAQAEYWRPRAALAFRERDLETYTALLKERIGAAPEEAAPRLMLARSYYFARDFARARLTLPLSTLRKDPSCLAGEIHASLLRDEDPDRALELLDHGRDLLTTASNNVHATLRARAEGLRRHKARDGGPGADPTRITQILGTSFCGSTILSMVLGQAEGVCNVGESHRMVRSRREDRQGYRNEPFVAPGEKDADREPEHCLTCGPSCDLFDDRFRAALRDDPVDHLPRVLEKSGARHLVAADKTSACDVDPLLRFNAIVMFKEPRNALRSHLKRQRAHPGLAKYAADPGAYYDFWFQYYADCLRNFRIKGQRIFLSFEAFSADPAAVVARLEACLSIETGWRGGRIRTDGQHMFGGNRELLSGNDFAVRTAETGEVDGHAVPEHVADVYSALLARHRETFEQTPA